MPCPALFVGGIVERAHLLDGELGLLNVCLRLSAVLYEGSWTRHDVICHRRRSERSQVDIHRVALGTLHSTCCENPESDDGSMLLLLAVFAYLSALATGSCGGVCTYLTKSAARLFVRVIRE